MEFSCEELLRYSRQMMLPEIGKAGQEKLKAARVLVVGAGGLGCPCMQYLAASGCGNITIIDHDKVELHNLNRQILYNHDDLGKDKAETAREKILLANPYLQVEAITARLNTANAGDLVPHFDLVIDGSDNFETRFLVNDVCVQFGKPLVYGTILQWQAQLAVFNYKGGMNLRDVFPEPPNPEDVPNCDQIGVLGVITGIIGSYMSLAAIKIILEQPIPNKIWLFGFEDFTHSALDLEME